MPSIASDDDHSSTTTDDHDTSSTEDPEPVGGTTSNEHENNIPALVDADVAESNTLTTEFDVITIHGFHGDSNETWQARDESKRETVRGLADFRENVNFRLMNYGFTTPKELSKDSIIEEASDLLRELTEARKLRDKDIFRAIVFVCHDIGGAIVKQALCQSIADPQYADIANSTKWIIFLGYPHRWYSVHDMEEKIARLVFSGPKLPHGNVLLQVKNLARAVIECNQDFEESKIVLSTEILSIHSDLTDRKEYVFDEYESVFRTGFTFRKPCAQPHWFLPCAEEMSSLCSEFESFKERLKLGAEAVEKKEAASYLNALVSQASPVRSIPLNRSHSHSIMNNPSYIDWLQNSRSGILVIQRQKSMQWVSPVAFEDILPRSSSDSIKTYFSFDQNDDRYNNTRAFLSTTAAQWVTKEAVMESYFDIHMHMSRFHSQHALTDDDLLIMLNKLRSIYQDGETVFVLDNLDECADKLSSFWQWIAVMMESREQPWKILIFTKSVDNLDGWLKSWPSIALEDELSLDDIDPCVRDEIDYALHQFKIRYAGARSILRYRDELLRKCGNDIGLTRLLLQDLQNCQSQEMLTETLKTLADTTVEALCERAMGFIPEAKRELVAKAIILVLFAFYPLSTGELKSALATSEQLQVSDENVVENILADIPIFDFSNTHNVCFQHAQIRDFILQSENVWYDIKATAHEVIAEICLNFLVSPTARTSCTTWSAVQYGVLSTPSVKPRTDLVAYAVCYWDEHYRRATEKYRLRPLILKLFQSKTLARQWQMARWFMSEPFSRTDRTCLSELPLLAFTGLEDIYQQRIEDENISEADQQQANSYAVAEAARNGHGSFALHLLPSLQLNNTSAEYILASACSGGSENILLEFISHIRTTLPSFTWPASLVRRAAWIGYGRVVQALIDDGADMKANDGSILDQTSLHVAARNGKLEVVKLLIKHDQSFLHARDKYNNTALFLAATVGDADIIRVLLEHGALPNEDEHIPISAASELGAPAAVRILLEHGAQTETTMGQDGTWPPLHLAVRNGAYKCVEILLESRANVNHDNPGFTPLNAAVENNRLDMVKVLVEHGADVNRQPDTNTTTDLHDAVSQPSGLEMIEYLVEKGADVNLRTPDNSPLYDACLNNNIAMARLLLEKGANVNEVLGEIWTPLHGAYQSAEITQLLLDAGATADRVLKDGRSPLYVAAEAGQTEVVELLLKHDVDINFQYLPTEEEVNSGFTPLLAALNQSHGSVVRLLLEAGADTSIGPSSGLLPLYYAYTTEILRIMLEFRPDLALEDRNGDTALNSIMDYPPTRIDDVKLLVHAGSDINAANKLGVTALHKCITRDRLDIAQFLLKRGADLEAFALQGNGAPLHQACWLGNVAAVRLLVNAGANVNAVDKDLGSPAQTVCRCSSPFYRDQVEDLMLDILRCLSNSDDSASDSSSMTTRKFDVNATGGLHGSALAAACYRATVPVIQFLLDLGAVADTCDKAGRYPIHLAAVGQSTENFEALRNANADLYARDKAGRTVLHFAVISGRLDVLRCVLQATNGLLEQPDYDGWTPLHYAARGFHRFVDLNGEEQLHQRKQEVVTFLIDEGADVWAQSSERDGKKWSPLKLANYHGANQQTLDLLTPKIKMSPEGKAWDDEIHSSKKASPMWPGHHCDACLMKVDGIRYACKNCWDFDFCSKCYARRDILHPHQDHEWEPMGQDYEDDTVAQPEAAEVDSETDNDTDSDSDDSST